MFRISERCDIFSILVRGRCERERQNDFTPPPFLAQTVVVLFAQPFCKLLLLLCNCCCALLYKTQPYMSQK